MAGRPTRMASPTDFADVPHEVWPLDIAILKMLPHEAQMLGGVHYMGKQVKAISDALGEHVTSAQVNSRMRMVKANGFGLDRPATGGRVWQRTTKGEVWLVQNGHLDADDVSEAAQEALTS